MPSEKTPEDIRRHMDALRSTLDNDVQEVPWSVRAKSNWRYYVKSYPCLTLG
ncbi:hypothetical protein [Adhaeretor mobilis]|uniref:hypothetical protein n=1 Tax=Adhaeretor mobilis TaxID=1930276 RepID=UPI001C54E9A0|nr:hypothetical protein [Adhaeretor mobilis]